MALMHRCCIPKYLPAKLHDAAAARAISINPLNRAPVERLAAMMPGMPDSRAFISVLTTKYWHSGGVDLSVSFMDNPSAALRSKLLQNMNTWGDRCNVRFRETNGVGQVRISRHSDDAPGYWSYLGTDILTIPSDQQTMNLEDFTEATPDSEFHRVVRHETGHTIGCPHEHMRADLVAKLDRAKTLEYFERTQGWSEAMVIAQVLTPLEEGSLWGTPRSDQSSIMCYQIPGEITNDGQPILGGKDIDATDFDFMAKVYPKPDAPTTSVAAAADASDVTKLKADQETLLKTIALLLRQMGTT